MICWLGIWTLTETEVFTDLPESAEPGAGCPRPSRAPLRTRGEAVAADGLRCPLWRGSPRERGRVLPSRGVAPRHEVGVASLPTPLPRAGSCLPPARLGLGASISGSREPLSPDPRTPLLMAAWHSGTQGTKRTSCKGHVQLK